MRELSAKEKDLLYRIENKPELQPFFFRKAKGLHWFDPLSERGFFSPEKNPRPIPAKEEGYVNIPSWPAAEYLVATLSEVDAPENEDYAVKYLEVIRKATCYARRNEYSNCRTWRQFAKIIGGLPVHLISEDDLELIDYWLDDPYERGLTANELGEKWLPKLLDGDEHSASLALRLLDKLFSVCFVEEKLASYGRKKAQLRFKPWHAKKIVEKVARCCGQRLGISAVQIFESKLVAILEKLKNDSWSSVWRGAIEEHEQNRRADDAKDVLIAACRESLLGAIERDLSSSDEYLRQLLVSQYQTLRRLAVYAVNQNFRQLNKLTELVIVAEHFSENLRHEVWHFLTRNYEQFQDIYKNKVLEIIENLTIKDDDGNVQEGPTAYRRSIWLSAIKDSDERAASLYRNYVGITDTEPEHPDFSSYMFSGWVKHESPIPLDDLLSLEITQLLATINNYKDSGRFGEPGIEGLAKAFKDVVKSRALDIILELGKFVKADLAYVHEIVEAFHELWNEKSKLPWNDIWPRLLKFCEILISDDEFWSIENSQQREDFVANRHWVVISIARLIEDGTKTDDHAFAPDLLPKARSILILLLKKQEGGEFKHDSDAVPAAINSPRGCCIEAMVNLTLRSCRLMDKAQKGHSDVWKEFESIYDDELRRNELGEYEFATLVTYYLPNFLYMSKEWVYANLASIFDKSDYQKWLCAMQGYAYVGSVYQEIYRHLKENGDFVAALDDQTLKDRVREKVIQNIAVSYIHDYESLSDRDSLISVLLERRDYDELRQLIWFAWTLHGKDIPSLSAKIYELWPKLLQIVDLEEKNGRKLASSLCHWSVFIDEITDSNRDWLLMIAPHAEEGHDSYVLLESLARISNSQPLEAQRIWLEMLKAYFYDYPEESIKQILANLVNVGPEGERKAKEVVDAYLRHGIERPRIWLKEIMMK